MLVFSNSIQAKKDKATGIYYMIATACTGWVTEESMAGFFSRRGVMGTSTVIGKSKDKKAVNQSIKSLKANSADGVVAVDQKQHLCDEAAQSLEMIFGIADDLENSVKEETDLRQELAQKNELVRKRYLK